MTSGDPARALLGRALAVARVLRRDGRGVYLFVHRELGRAWVGRPGRVLANHGRGWGPSPGSSEPGDPLGQLRAYSGAPAFLLLGPHLRSAPGKDGAGRGLVVVPDLEIELDADAARVSLGAAESWPDLQPEAESLPTTLPHSDWSAWASEIEPAFLDRVRQAAERVQGRDGKIILTRSFSRPIPPGRDPLDLGVLLLGAEPLAAASHYLELPGGFVSMGASPENIFEATEQGVVLDVVAGSRPAGAGAQDAEWEAELLASEKEAREHGMALGRGLAFLKGFCEFPSIALEFSRRVRRLRRIRHLHSRVSGRLRSGLDGLDILAACYPPLASYPADLQEGLDPLEPPPDFYGGVVGRWASPMAFSAFLNLRALELEPGRIRTKSGAGIVDGADPVAECAEIMLKLASVLDPVEVWLNSGPSEGAP